MGSFSASLKTLGDRRGLPATITLERGRLTIDAGDQPIGDWSLDEIHLEPTGRGYRMVAEGEQIIIELSELEAFTNELNTKMRKTRRGRIGSGSRDRAKKTKATEKPRAQTVAEEPRSEKVVEKPPAKKAKKERPVKAPKARPEKEKAESTVWARVDRWLVVAEERWGSLLPQWVFTRLMFALVVLALLVTIFFPSFVSLLLLVAGVLIVMLGAILYTDQVLAARYLPGRMSPMHVLLFGVTILMLGVLVGVIA